jgi:hypothetical protein
MEHEHWITKGYGHTLRISNIYCFSKATMVMQTHLSVMLHICCVSCYLSIYCWICWEGHGAGGTVEEGNNNTATTNTPAVSADHSAQSLHQLRLAPLPQLLEWTLKQKRFKWSHNWNPVYTAIIFTVHCTCVFICIQHCRMHTPKSIYIYVYIYIYIYIKKHLLMIVTTEN